MKKLTLLWAIFSLLNIFLVNYSFGNTSVIGQALNAPNPFSATSGTKIVYELSQPDNIVLVIYNQLGQEVHKKQFHSGQNGGKQHNAIAINQREIKTLNLSNGVYFYLITTGTRILAKGKMALI